MSERKNQINKSNSGREMMKDSSVVEEVEFETSIPILKENFFFHELFKSNSKTNHYIIEDIMIDPQTLADPTAPLFFYLKQRKYSSKSHFIEAKKYYSKFLEYCKSPFSKNDIIKLHYIFDGKDKDSGGYELVTIFDYGEPDRIDLKNISDPHINKFLKNVCILLTELKDFNGMYNGNLNMKNIVLAESELKMSGFSPIYAPKDKKIKKWKNKVAKKYGVHRLDLFLLGILWLKFLKVDFGKKLASKFPLKKIQKEVKKIVVELSQTRKMDIINKLVSLEEHPKLNLEEVVLDFDEYYILENIKIVSDRGNHLTSSKTFRTLESSKKDGKGYYESKSRNIFKKSLIDSETNMAQSRFEDQITAKMFNSSSKNIRGNGITFTLKENDSEIDESGGKLMNEIIDKTFDFSKGNKEAVIEDINKQLNKKKSINDDNKMYISLRSNSGDLSLIDEEDDKKIKAKIAKANRRMSGPVPQLNKLNFKEKETTGNRERKGKVNMNNFKERQKRVLEQQERKRFSFGIQISDRKSFSDLAKDILSKRETISVEEQKEMIRKSVEIKHETIKEVEENNFTIDSAFYEKITEEEIQKRKEEQIEKTRKEEEEIERKRKEIEELEKRRKRASVFDDLKQPRLKKVSPDKKHVLWEKDDSSIIIEEGSISSGDKNNTSETKAKQQTKSKETEPNKAIQIDVLVEDKNKNKEETKIEKTIKDVDKEEAKEDDKINVLKEDNEKKLEESSSKDKPNLKGDSEVKDKKPVNKKNFSKKNKPVVKSNALKKKKQSFNHNAAKKRFTPKDNANKKTTVFRSKSVIHQNKRKKTTRKSSVQSNKRKPSINSQTNPTSSKQTKTKTKSKFYKDKKPISRINTDIGKSSEVQKKTSFTQNKKSKKDKLQQSNTQKNTDKEKQTKKENNKFSENKKRSGFKKKIGFKNSIYQYRNKPGNQLVRRKTVADTNSLKLVEPQKNNQKNNETISFTNKSFNETLSVTSNNSKLSDTGYLKMKQPFNSPTVKDNNSPTKKNNFFSYKTEANEINKQKEKLKMNNSLRKKNSLQLESKKSKDGVSIDNMSRFAMYNNSVKDSDQTIGRENKRKIINSKTSFSRFKDPSFKLTHVTTNVTEISVEKKFIYSSLKKEKDSSVDQIIKDSKEYIDDKEFESANKQLLSLLSWLENYPIKKAEVLYLIGKSYIGLEEIDKSIEYNNKCIYHINEQTNRTDYEETLKLALVSLASCYINKADYKKAEEVLKRDVFIANETFPDDYYELMGDIYTNQLSNIEAYNTYRKKFNSIRKKRMEGIYLTDFLKFAEKMLLCLEKNQRESEMKSLHSQVLGQIESYFKGRLLCKDDNNYTDLREKYILDSMVLFLHNKNYKFVVFLLEDFENSKNDFLKLKTKERLQLIDVYIEIINIIKNNPMNEENKLLYVNFLKRSKMLIEKCEDSQKKLKKELFINFNLGLYYLKEDMFGEGEKTFKRSLEVYDKHTSKPIEERISIYCNIAICLYHLGKYKESVSYFEKIKETENKDKQRTHQSTKMLAKTYYRLGEFDKCRESLKQEVTNYIKKKEDRSSGFGFYLFLYFVVCHKTKHDSHNKLLTLLRKQLDDKGSVDDIFTFNILFNFYNLSSENYSGQKNKRILNEVNNVLKKEKETDFPLAFTGVIDKIISKYVFNKEEDEDNNTIIYMIYNRNKDIQQNCQIAIEYYINILFTFLNVVPFDNKSDISESKRNELLNKIKRLKKNKDLYKSIIDSYKNKGRENKEESVESFKMFIIDQKQSDSTKKLSESSITKIALKPGRQQKRNSIRITIQQAKQLSQLTSPTNNEQKRKGSRSPSNQKRRSTKSRSRSNSAKVDPKRVKKLNSNKFLKQSNLKKINKCICSSRRIKGGNIHKHIDSFFKQLKNMFSLDITDSIDKYYTKFEGLIKDKRVNWEKYIYVKKLCQFYFANKKQKTFKMEKFSSLMDGLLQTPDLCLHDIEMMIILLESFKDVSYVECFLLYLDNLYEDILTVIIQEVILLNFDKKYNEVKEFIFEKQQNRSFYEIENSPFFHYLDEENKLTIQEEFTFKVYKRIRWLVLANLKLRKTFLKYLQEQQLFSFYLRYTTYSAVVDCIRKDVPSFKIIQTYQKKVDEIISLKDEKSNFPVFFSFDFLLLVSLLKLNESDNEQTVSMIVELLKQFSVCGTDDSCYSFVFASSQIGNILFKNRLYKDSISAKTLSLDILKKNNNIKLIKPEYIREKNIEQLLFNVLTHIFMNQTYLNNKEEAKQILNEIEKIKTRRKKEEVELKCMRVICFMGDNEYGKAEKKLMELREDIFSSESDSFDLNIYKAIVERILLDIKITKSNKNEIEKQREKTKTTLQELFNSLIKTK